MADQEKKTRAYIVRLDYLKAETGDPGCQFPFAAFTVKRLCTVDWLVNFIEGRTDELPGSMEVTSTTLPELIRFRNKVIIGTSRTFAYLLWEKDDEKHLAVYFDPPYLE